MDYFNYKKNNLYAENISIADSQTDTKTLFTFILKKLLLDIIRLSQNL